MSIKKTIEKFITSYLLLSCFATGGGYAMDQGQQQGQQQVQQQNAAQDAHHERVGINVNYLKTDITYSDSGRFLENLVFRQMPIIDISGSSQYTEKQFNYILYDIVTNNNLKSDDVFVVVDLRGEAHLFVQSQFSGLALSAEPLILADNNKREIEHDQENEIIAALQGQQIIIKPHRFATGHPLALSGETELQKVLPITIPADSTSGIGHLETEEQMVKRVAQNIVVPQLENLYQARTDTPKINLEYVRVPVPDLSVPTLDLVSSFVTQIKQIEARYPNKRIWLHFHCHGGLGRTAFFMCVAAIYRSNDDLTKIVQDQAKSGGRDLLDIEHPEIGQSLENAKGVRQNLIQVYLNRHPERKLEFSTTKFVKNSWVPDFNVPPIPSFSLAEQEVEKFASAVTATLQEVTTQETVTYSAYESGTTAQAQATSQALAINRFAPATTTSAGVIQTSQQQATGPELSGDSSNG